MNTQMLEVKETEVVQTALSIVITNNDEETFAVEYCKIIKNLQKEVNDTFDPIVEKAHQTHKEATTQRNRHLNPLLEAEKAVKQRIKDYRLMLEQKRQEEERIAKERMDRIIKAEQEKLMQQAEEAKDKGDNETADKLAVQAVSTEAGGVFVESKAKAQEGLSSSIVWKGRVVDLSQVPQEFLIITPNQKAIDAYIKIYGKNNPIKGVEYYQDVNLGVRTK